MRIRVSVPEEHVSPHVINAALEAVTRLDETLIKNGQAPTASQLIEQGAKWKPEAPGDECFDHVGIIAKRGYGDCDDWAPARAAELRVQQVDPGAKAIVIPSGPYTYHAVVQRSDGSIDDPSIAAGMKPLSHGRVEGVGAGSIQILACDPHDPSRTYQGALLPTTSPMSLHCGPQFAVRRVSGCFEGRCDVPLAGSMSPVKTRSVSGAAMPYALVHQATDVHPAYAVAHAVTGAIQTAEACGCAAPEDYVKLVALQGMLCGLPPYEVYEALSRSFGEENARTAVVGAHRVAKRFVRHHRRRHRAHRVQGIPHAAQRAF